MQQVKVASERIRPRGAVSLDFLQRGLPDRHYRPELHGVRGLAILGVVLFHLFGAGRVSGGIDIFLAISGFLFTAMLLREAATAGARVDFVRYFARLIRRILIPAAIVVAATLAAGLVIRPDVEHHQLLAEARASLLYFENFELINSQLAYGAAGPETSPFQHFWSLSVQGQFYLVWPLVAIAAVVIARFLRRSAVAIMVILVAVIFLTSLVYAVYYGSFSQDEAYLMSRTRAWELAFGGLLALLGARLTLPAALRLPAGWFGLGLIVSCGFVIDGAQEFPGLLAFWPLGGLTLVLASAGPAGGLKDPKPTASRFLSNPVFAWIGDRAYGLYLWHWPLLVFYLEIRQREAVGLAGATAVLAVTVVLTEIMYRLVERPIAKRKVLTIDWRVLSAGATAMLLVGIGMTSAVTSTAPEPDPVAFDPQTWDWGVYPGAQAALEGNAEMDGSDTYLPDPATLHAYSPRYGVRGCNQTGRNAPGTEQLIICEDENKPDQPRRTVVVTGGSHAGQWEAAWYRMGQKYDWEILIVIKSGCVFADYGKDPEKSSCQAWQDNFIDWLDERHVDLVVTPGTRMTRSTERIMEGAPERWQQITDKGTRLLLTRGTPRPPYSPAVSTCLAEEKTALQCGANANQILPRNPLETIDLPAGAFQMDLTPAICPEEVRANGTCPAIVGNVPVWHDNSHLTGTYVETMVPYFEERLLNTAPWLIED